MRSCFVRGFSFETALFTAIGFFLCVLFLFPSVSLAASLSFSPASGSYGVGDTVSVGVFVSSASEAVNAVSGIVSFPNDVLEISSISKNSSVISLWVQEPTFSNAAGTVNFEGIVLNPGYTGSGGRVITLNLRVKKSGTGYISFTSGSVLANDGIGTDVLSKLGTASFSFAAKEIPEVVPVGQANDTSQTTPGSFTIESTSHPAGRWSNKTTGNFNFVLPPAVKAIRLLIDKKDNSIPTILHEPAITSREINDLPEGISYLHAQSKTAGGWGEITHYQLQIDTVTPTALVITPVQIESPEPDFGSFTFSAADTLSGIDYYEIQVDSADKIKFTDLEHTEYKTSSLEPGEHTILVKVFDKAGNFSEATETFTVKNTVANETSEDSSDTQSINGSPIIRTLTTLITVLSIVIPFIALVALLLILLYLSWKSVGGLKRRIRKEVDEAKSMVRRAFALLSEEIREDIQTLEKASKKRTLTKEEIKILKRLKMNIEQAELIISKELTDVENELK